MLRPTDFRIRFTCLKLPAAIIVAASIFAASPSTAQDVPAVSPDFLLRYLPDHALAAVVAKPAKLVQHTELDILGNVPLLGQLPLPATEIESVVAFAAIDPLQGEPTIGLVMQLRHDVFRPTILKWLMTEPLRVEEAAIDTYRGKGTFKLCAFPEARTVIACGDDALLHFMLESKVGSPLSKRVRALILTGDLIAAVEVGRIRSLVDHPYAWRESQPAIEWLNELPRELGMISVDFRFGKRKSDFRVEVAKRDDVEDSGRLRAWVPSAGTATASLLQIGASLAKTRLWPEEHTTVDEITATIDAALLSLKPELQADGMSLSAPAAPLTRLAKHASKLMLPMVMVARNTARENMMRNNVKQVTLAWMMHHDRYGVFPSDILSKDGKPLLSWRVRILPFLDEELLFKDFHLDEPWDSAHNKALLAKMPSIYKATRNPEADRTQVQGIVGKGCILPGPTRINAIRDPKDITMHVVEAKEFVSWTKPADIPFKTSGMYARLNPGLSGSTLMASVAGTVNLYPRLSDETYTRLFLFDDRMNPLSDGELNPDSAQRNERKPLTVADLRAAIQATEAKVDVVTARRLTESVFALDAVPAEIRAELLGTLRRLMQSEDSLIRTWGTLALSETVSPTEFDMKLLDDVIRRAERESRWMLMSIWARKADPQIARLLAKQTANPFDRHVGVLLLSKRFSPNILAELLSDPDPEIVLRMCEVLEACGNPEQSDALKKLPADSPARVAATRAIEAIARRTEADDPVKARERDRLRFERDKLLRQAQAVLNQGNAAAAEEAVRTILGIEETLFGPNHDDALSRLEWLGRRAQARGDVAEAKKYSTLRIERLTARFGRTHWKTKIAVVDQDNVEAMQKFGDGERKTWQRGNEAGARAAKDIEAKKFDAAIVAIREATEAYESVRGKHAVIVANQHRTLRNLYVTQKKYAEAEKEAQLVYEADTATIGEDHPVTVVDAAEWAYLKFECGEQTRAIEQLRRLAPRLEAVGKFQDAAAMYEFLAQNPTSQDRSNVEADFRHAVRLFDLAGVDRSAAWGCNKLGNSCAARGDSQAAETWWYDSQWRFEKVDPVLAAFVNLPKAAKFYQETGRPHLALVVRQAAVDTWSAAPKANPGLLAILLTELAGTQIVLGDFILAEQTLARALAAEQKQEVQPFWRIERMLLTAQVQEHLGDRAAARSSLMSAAALAEKQALARSPACLEALIELHLRDGDTTTAIQAAEKAVALAKGEPTEAGLGAYSRLSTALLAAGKRDQAKVAYAAVETMFRQLEPKLAQPETWIEHARLTLEFGDPPRARELCNKGIEAAERAGGADGIRYVETLSAAAPLLLRAEDPAAAETAARNALRSSREIVERSAYILSPRQQISLAQAMRRSVDMGISVALANHGHAKDLFAEIYRWKGSALLRQRELQKLRKQEDVMSFYDQLGKITTRLSTASRSAADLRTDQSKNPQLAAQEANVDQLAGLQDLLETQLSASRLAYLDFQKPSELPDFTAALKPDQVCVDLFLFQQYDSRSGLAVTHVLATIVRGTGVTHSLDLGPLAPIRAAIVEWRETLGESSAALKAGERLRSLVWDPLLVGIKPQDLVLISPDGPLGGIPLFAMRGRNGKYLIEEYRIALIPVPQMLPAMLEAENRPVTSGTVLAVGDIDYDQPTNAKMEPADRPAFATSSLRGVRGSQSFTPLPGTAAEIEFLEQYHKKAGFGIEVLRHAEASESMFRKRAGESRILHMATHGFFAEPGAFSAESVKTGASNGAVGESHSSPRVFDAGLMSGLALAGANRKPEAGGDDGVLTASEIAVLDLTKIDLAVLSACETGLGKEAEGEGLLGIQRAFQIAGVRSTVASFWKVDDRATQVLMERFYLNCRDKRLGKLDALREAQIWMLNHPAEVWTVGTTADARGDRRLSAAPRQPTDGRLSPRYWAAFAISGDVGPIILAK